MSSFPHHEFVTTVFVLMFFAAIYVVANATRGPRP